MLLTIIGGAIVISVIPRAGLQALRVFRCGTSTGLSPTAALGVVWNCSWWLTYAVLIKDPTQLASNAMYLVAYLTIVGFMLRERRVTARVALYSAVVMVTAMACVGVTHQPVIAASIGAVSGLLCDLPQCWECWKRPGGVAISVVARSVSIASSLSWCAYGYLASDAFVVSSSALALLINIFVVSRTVYGRRIEAAKLKHDADYSQEATGELVAVGA